jgi:3-phosphoshikimate 1-carboxyvinyltransferase
MTKPKPQNRKSRLLVQPQTKPLAGAVTVPGDKSISHRAVMFASLAEGNSVIGNWLPAGDTIATLDAFRALVVAIAVEAHSDQAWQLLINGRGLHGLQPPSGPLDCRNAGTCLRLLAGIMAGQRFAGVLDGSEQLRRRPMGRVCEPLRQMGARIEDNEGRAPLSLQPAALQSIDYHLNVASAQVKSAILLAGLYAEGETRVYQPGPARDHTERILQAMGVEVATSHQPPANSEQCVALRGPVTRLAPLDLTVPGDMSSAAFPLIAAAIVPHSRVTVGNVGINRTRTGLLDLLKAMGAHVTINDERITGVSRPPI